MVPVYVCVRVCAHVCVCARAQPGHGHRPSQGWVLLVAVGREVAGPWACAFPGGSVDRPHVSKQCWDA